MVVVNMNGYKLVRSEIAVRTEKVKIIDKNGMEIWKGTWQEFAKLMNKTGTIASIMPTKEFGQRNFLIYYIRRKSYIEFWKRGRIVKIILSDYLLEKIKGMVS